MYIVRETLRSTRTSAICKCEIKVTNTSRRLARKPNELQKHVVSKCGRKKSNNFYYFSSQTHLRISSRSISLSLISFSYPNDKCTCINVREVAGSNPALLSWSCFSVQHLGHAAAFKKSTALPPTSWDF